MGREVRRVPRNWNHPKDKKGRYIPLLDEFAKRLEEWNIGKEKWDLGLVDDYNGGWKKKDTTGMAFEEWYGKKPVEKDYMPTFKPEERTHYQMYETCSEGTPISPVMETPEELARWLADNGASAFGEQTASYEAWLNTINSGGACSFYLTKEHHLISGVEAQLKFKKDG
jgi:hypothetical protein